MSDADGIQSENAAAAGSLADRLQLLAGDSPRFIAALAGPPGAGKSTLAEALMKALQERGEQAIVVPMDGFHFDDTVLIARGHRSRKGAPFTFDCAGFEVLLRRIRASEPDVAIPLFDRERELSRAAAAIVDAQTRFIIVEGNYLLLAEEPWARLRTLFDYCIFLDVPPEELQRRLLKRIQSFGRSREEAEQWLAGNDLPNIQHVLCASAAPDLRIRVPPSDPNSP